MTHSKTFFTVLLVGVVVGGFYFQSSNPALFKGFIGQEIDTIEDNTAQVNLPDLEAQLELIAPAQGEEDLKASATIANVGEGAVLQGQPFKYTIFINDVEVFSNTDSYTSIEPGDSFNFIYPIPYRIYQYPKRGNVRFVVDPENSISETNEENNQTSQDYDY